MSREAYIESDRMIDELEAKMLQYDQIECPLIHRFTPSLYSREIFMPPDSLVTSKVHATCHQFTVSKGSVYVRINDDNWERIEAPHTAITYPGTRRVLYTEEGCVWTTYHPIQGITGEENSLSEDEKQKLVKEIEDLVLYKYENKLLWHTQPSQLEA